MHGYRVLRAQGGVVPYQFVDLSGGVYPSRILHEQQQDVVLNGREACLLYTSDAADE